MQTPKPELSQEEVSRRIIIGSETEYGIFLYDENNPDADLNDSHNSLEACEAMLDEASKHIKNIFKGISDRIENEEDHDRLEEAIWLRRMDQEELGNYLFSLRGEAQRRGFSGNMLPNGARYYIDMLHPEYSCPEADNPRDAVLVQKAGDAIVALSRMGAEECLRRKLGRSGLALHIIKNNSDGNGNSYAAHENYCLSPWLYENICFWATVTLSANQRRKNARWRSYETETLTYEKAAHILKLFFVARQIITGAGKASCESGIYTPYQISQRADFIKISAGESTTRCRGIINLRDSSYAENARHRRLHVICGDGNMSELSLFLKFGMTALVLMMLEDRFFDGLESIVTVPLSQEVKAFHTVSRDLSLRKKLKFKNNKKASALDVMIEFAAVAKRYVTFKNLGTEWQRVVDFWEKVNLGLGGDRHSDAYAGKLDWVIKERLIAQYLRRPGAKPGDWVCREIDLDYHNLNPELNLYEKVLRDGHMMRIVEEEEVKSFLYSPPQTTRAWLRGEIVRRYTSAIVAWRWDGGFIKNGCTEWGVRFYNPYWGGKNDAEFLFQNDPPLEEFLRRLLVFSRTRQDSGIAVFSTTRRNPDNGGDAPYA